ncbi:uncharacterized protein [Anoplolepis gracilipes]|uniref:uncharacterized protein n=1 Tax=Anoplolepis gracilipes TaxID=354296 RepID=UPI003B9F64F4
MDISKHLGHADYEFFITLNRACLKLLGIWPEPDERNGRTKWVMNTRVFTILIIIVWSTLIPTLHCLIRIWGNITSMIDNLQYSLPILIAIMKLVLMWHKKNVLKPILKMVKEDWTRLKTEKERAIMVRCAQIARLIMIWGCFIMVLSFILIVIFPCFGISVRYLTNITDPGRLMPLQTYYMYNVNNSPLYEVIFVLQGFSLMTAGMIYSGTDTFMGFLVFHVCGQLENLKARILSLGFNRFEDSLSSNIMIQGRNLSIGRLIFILTSFMNTFTHMCLYCVVGEFLVIQCDGIYMAVYQCKWYNLKPSQARNLLIMMIQAKKPLYLTAGKLFPMTMSTFCGLLKTSGGYISVLLAHRN